MKYTVYLYDSVEEKRSARLVEADNEDEAIDKAIESYCQTYNIPGNAPFWRKNSITAGLDPKILWWLK